MKILGKMWIVFDFFKLFALFINPFIGGFFFFSVVEVFIMIAGALEIGGNVKVLTGKKTILNINPFNKKKNYKLIFKTLNASMLLWPRHY